MSILLINEAVWKEIFFLNSLAFLFFVCSLTVRLPYAQSDDVFLDSLERLQVEVAADELEARIKPRAKHFDVA